MKSLPDIQLVITAPDPDGSQIAHDVKARTTLGVLTTLIAQAQKTIVLAAPFFQQDEGLSQEPLAGALITALKRGVIVDFASTRAGLDTLDREMLRGIASGYIRFFQPSTNYEDASKLGLHAKFCVADKSRAYIGSANLTKPGLHHHFEMGVLVKGEVARQTSTLWEYLVDKQFFIEVN
jgi:phosphatidylserine/phosphatidylglycerophosphate/cardiolipin synthase-like enzyme